MIKNSVIIKVDNKNYDYVIKKIINNGLSIIKTKFNKDNALITLTIDDYNTLKKVDYKNAIILCKIYTLKTLLNFMLINIDKFIFLFLLIIFLFISNNFIFQVNVNTDDLLLKNKINNFLIDNNLEKFTLKVNYKKINKIKNEILNKYPNDVSWIEISNKGNIYNIDLIKKISNDNIKQKSKCDYVAKKSGIITKINVNRGMVLVDLNNFVNKDDILISGSITYNDELKDEICANGKIYGEVWYITEISYPLVSKDMISNNKHQYNLKINFKNKNYYIFNNFYNNHKNILEVGNNKLGISIEKSFEKKLKKVKISPDEAYELALKKIKKNILLKTGKNSKILSQKVLKKYVKNDTIYLKVLLSLEEELGVVESY